MNSPEKDVTVSTKITGLTAGKDYVAELYVDNESDAKATLSVNTGSKEVSNYTMRSFSRNTVASDEKHGTNMQRILVSFTAEGTIADLKLSRAAGEGSTYWDDIRIVQTDTFLLQRIQNPDGSFRLLHSCPVSFVRYGYHPSKYFLHLLTGAETLTMRQ